MSSDNNNGNGNGSTPITQTQLIPVNRLSSIQPRPAGVEIDTVNMEKLRIDPNWALRVPANLALRRSMLPFALADNKVLVACADPAGPRGPGSRRTSFGKASRAAPRRSGSVAKSAAARLPGPDGSSHARADRRRRRARPGER